MSVLARPPTVVVVATGGLQLHDLAGQVEVLRTANHVGLEPPYRILLASPGALDDSGVRVGADVVLGELARCANPSTC